MTHEAGMEAASTVAFDWSGNAFYPDFEMETSEYVSRIIQAYLSASGMVLVPREPTEQMMKSELDKAIYKAYLADAPDPFKSKP